MYACQKWYFYRNEKGIYRLRQIFVHCVRDKPHVARTPLLVFNNKTTTTTKKPFLNWHKIWKMLPKDIHG